MEEIQALYGAFSQGQSSPLPELPLQYADFACWQRQYLQGQTLDRQLDYWKAQFERSPVPVLALPTDRPRPATQTYRGASLSHPLPPTLIQELEALGRQENASLFMTMFAAFQTLLYRYSGQGDIVIGVPIANRNRPEIENMAGFFANTLPLRGKLHGRLTFRELMERARRLALDAYAHQDLPLETLIESLDVERNPSYNLLFQVFFAVQNVPVHAIQLPDVRIDFVQELNTGTTKVDLTVFVEFPDFGPTLIAEYNTDLFDAATIARLLGHFQTLLEGIVANPDQRLDDLPWLTRAERQQLLLDWNATQSDYPRLATVQQLFEAQAAQTPHAPALVLPSTAPGQSEQRLTRLLCFDIPGSP